MFKRTYEPPDDSSTKMQGYWTAELRSGGILKARREGHNVITTNGKEELASFLNSAAAAASTFTMQYISVGTDATAEAASNTALGTELDRHTGTVSYISGQIFQVKATFTSGNGTGALVEYGLFNSNTGGTMLSRDTESVINKGASDELTVTAQITFS